MKKLFSILLLTLTFCAYAQEDNRGTIKVQKKGNVYAVMFDNVNNRLIGQDNYGNILDSAVISYNVMLTIQGITFPFFSFTLISVKNNVVLPSTRLIRFCIVLESVVPKTFSS